MDTKNLSEPERMTRFQQAKSEDAQARGQFKREAEERGRKLREAQEQSVKSELEKYDKANKKEKESISISFLKLMYRDTGSMIIKKKIEDLAHAIKGEVSSPLRFDARSIRIDGRNVMIGTQTLFTAPDGWTSEEIAKVVKIVDYWYGVAYAHGRSTLSEEISVFLTTQVINRTRGS